MFPLQLNQVNLERSSFTVTPFDDASKRILNLTGFLGRIVHLGLHLFNFDFNFLHNAGIKVQPADQLPLPENTGTEETSVDGYTIAPGTTLL